MRSVDPGDLVGGQVPTQLAGICVEINSERAPIFLVSPNQLNVQVPNVPQTGTVSVQVIGNCGRAGEQRSAAASVVAQAATPEFFFFTQSASGQNPIAAVNNVTGAYVGTPNLIAGGSFVPAQPGDILTLFMTGLGATTPANGPGVLPPSTANVNAAVSVSLGGFELRSTDILYAGVTPFYAGLYQVDIRIPQNAPTGHVPVSVGIGAFSTPAGGFITIGQ
jgi:uncharacterized protein (TIGR03437 family)